MALSARDKVRLAIGDTDMDDPLLFDDEIDFFLEENTFNGVVSVLDAAAAAALAISAKYARDYTFATDGQSFNRDERASHYHKLAEALRNRPRRPLVG